MGMDTATPSQVRDLTKKDEGWKSGKQKAEVLAELESKPREQWAQERRLAGWSDAEIVDAIREHDKSVNEYLDDNAKRLQAGEDAGSLTYAGGRWLKKIRDAGAAEDAAYNDKLIAQNQDVADVEAENQKRYLRSRLLKMSGTGSTFLTGPSGSSPKGLV